MKKLFVLLTCLSILTGNVCANEAIKNYSPQIEKHKEMRLQKEKAFEKRLNLTEEQKIKAKEIRVNGHKKIKPVVEKIIAKKQEAKMVKMSRISVQLQEERLKIIDKEIKALEKEAHKIRNANMKEFESILTYEQKKILKQMKKEGRKKYKTAHPLNFNKNTLK